MPRITVLVADPQTLFADALGIALQRCPRLEVLDERPESGADLIRAVERHRPKVVVTSYWLRDMEGPELVRAVHACAPGTKVIQLSWVYGPPQVLDALNAGAVAFLPKTITVDQLVESILRVQAGESLMSQEDIDRLLKAIDERSNAPRTWPPDPGR